MVLNHFREMSPALDGKSWHTGFEYVPSGVYRFQNDTLRRMAQSTGDEGEILASVLGTKLYYSNQELIGEQVEHLMTNEGELGDCKRFPSALRLVVRSRLYVQMQK